MVIHIKQWEVEENAKRSSYVIKPFYIPYEMIETLEIHLILRKQQIDSFIVYDNTNHMLLEMNNIEADLKVSINLCDLATKGQWTILMKIKKEFSYKDGRTHCEIYGFRKA